MTRTLAHQLADYACSLRFEDLSKEVVHEVKRRIIDSFGCALGAWNEEPCAIARKVASGFSAKNGSTIIGTAHQAPPEDRKSTRLNSSHRCISYAVFCLKKKK